MVEVEYKLRRLIEELVTIKRYVEVVGNREIETSDINNSVGSLEKFRKKLIESEDYRKDYNEKFIR